MKRPVGFTLIELMIVVAIIGILSGIAIPKFSQLINKGNEANTKGNLGALRSALAIYYSDTQGTFPSDTMTSLTLASKYIARIPPAKYPRTPLYSIGHSDTNLVTGETTPSDLSGWSYDNTIGNNNFGRLLAGCTHGDVKGANWSTY